MSNVAIGVFLLFLLFWVYTVFSIFFSEFKDSKAKVFWRIGIIFVPFLAFFYIFMKKNLIR